MEGDNVNVPKAATGGDRLGKKFSELSKELFEILYDQQVDFQQELVNKGKYNAFTDKQNAKLPCDDIHLFSYHMQQMMSELGEVLAADKRWKNYRNETTEEMLEHKKEELADCMIVLMNLCIFSGLSANEVLGAVACKINENFIRIRSK